MTSCKAPTLRAATAAERAWRAAVAGSKTTGEMGAMGGMGGMGAMGAMAGSTECDGLKEGSGCGGDGEGANGEGKMDGEGKMHGEGKMDGEGPTKGGERPSAGPAKGGERPVSAGPAAPASVAEPTAGGSAAVPVAIPPTLCVLPPLKGDGDVTTASLRIASLNAASGSNDDDAPAEGDGNVDGK